MVKNEMIPCGSAYWDNKLIFSFFLNLKNVFSLIEFWDFIPELYSMHLTLLNITILGPDHFGHFIRMVIKTEVAITAPESTS